MRRFLMTASFAIAAFAGLNAQKLDEVQEKFSKGKYDEAKEKIDKVLADSKNQSNPSAWYWKGNVYVQLAKADSMNQLSYDAAHEAFEAYKKYQQLDQKNVMMALEQNVGLFMLRDVYATKGDKYWSDKQYDKAYENFSKALQVQDYVVQKGFTYNDYAYPKLDTVLVRYTAAAAYSAKMEDAAIPYFEQLADANIAEKDFKDIYGLLVQYHIKKGNTAKAEKYLASGRQLFPDPDYWLSIELGDVGNDKAARIAKLKEMVDKYPDNGSLALDYAIDLRNDALIWDTKPADYNTKKEKYLAAVAKAAELNPTSELANFLHSEYYYIQISDLEDDLRAVRGNTPADVAKKKEINTKIDAAYEGLYTASMKAYELYEADKNMKIQDKANFRKVVNQLVDYYTKKKNTEKVTFYQNKLKTL